MSEYNPFSAVAEEIPAASDVAEDGGGSRKNLVLGGALAAVVLGAGAFFFLGGGDDAEEFTPVARAPRAAAAASPAPLVKKLPVTTKIALGRNPFRALYVQPAGGGGGGAAAGIVANAPVAAVPVTAPVQPAPVQPVAGQPAPAQPAAGQPAPAQPAPAQPAPAARQSTVSLKGVTAARNGANPTGTFVYDGQTVTGAPGDVMAGRLLVISLQQDNTGGWFANLQLGDGSPFEVHERQTVVVQ